MEAGISAGQGRGESTGVFRGLTLKPLCFDEQGQRTKWYKRHTTANVQCILLDSMPILCHDASQKAKANRHDAAGNKQTGSRSAVQDRSSEIPFCCASE
ncbi:hypothetical protein TsFJ059_007177 [Trichoderma semiorbis]|uniref:Uncharacterized protein n=1 Tax=Trichoderma semiorbis TaxID=1491008 RepID=A0A9P8HLJ4_9HYPO|nr:hypothetical protein TsFJ059_007177 [Trichoderma semiorbis]